MRYEVAVGGLLVVALGAVGLVASDPIGWGLTDTVDVTVPMTDAGGLRTGARVSVAGVDVGRVGAMVLSGDHAMVTLRLDPEAKLRHNLLAKIRLESLIGEKYVELTVREDAPDAPLLMDGDVLPRSGEQMDLDEVVGLAGKLLAAVEPEAVAVGLAGLTQALEEDPERLSRILANVDEVTGHAAVASRDLPAISGDVRVTLAGARSALRRMDARSEEAGYLLARADRVLAHLEAGAAPLPDAVIEAQRVLVEARDTLQRVDDATRSIQGLPPRDPAVADGVEEAESLLKGDVDPDRG